MFRLFDPGLGSVVGVIVAGRDPDIPAIKALTLRVGRRFDALIVAGDRGDERLQALGLPLVPGDDPLARAAAWAKAALPRVRGLILLPALPGLPPEDLAPRLLAGPAGVVVEGRHLGVAGAAFWPLDLVGRDDAPRAVVELGPLQDAIGAPHPTP